MPTRSREIRPDPNGYYRPYKGWKAEIVVTGEGTVEYRNRRQHRFNLGTDKREAERRYARLEQLWEENCKVAGEELWTPAALAYAEKIAKGQFRILIPAPRPEDGYADPIAEYAQIIEVERRQFPSLEIVPSDPELYAESVRRTKAFVQNNVADLQRELQELGALQSKDSLPADLIHGMLHEALDKYGQEDVRSQNVNPNTRDLTPYGRLRLERIERFKSRHEDIPLYNLNFDECSRMIAYWRNRPPTQRRDASSRDHARHHISELMRFFRWLDSTSSYEWRMPRGLERVRRRVPRTPDENRLSAITKPVYSPSELASLNRHATPLERLALYVGLNCAMGAAELGRLNVGDVLLFHKHEHQEALHFTSTERDSFIRCLRSKSSVFGEWLLWDETVRMIQWAIERARRIGSDVIFVSERGEEWYSERSKNPQAKFANTWKRLLDRVEKSIPNFRRLPFGTLRDVLPTYIRHHHNDQLASMVVAHGSPYRGDSLLECYGNKPFGALHNAIRKARTFFEPMFASAPAEPCKEGKHYLPIATMDEVRRLVEADLSPTEISRKCGVSTMTVYRVKAAIKNDHSTGESELVEA